MRNVFHLTEVLHIPDLPCNVIGLTPDIGKITELSPKGDGYMFDRDETTTACWTVHGAAGVMDVCDYGMDISNCTYLPSMNARFITWEKKEHERWLWYQAALRQPSLLKRQPSLHSSSELSPTIAPGGTRPSHRPRAASLHYSLSEQLWIRSNFHSEARFLRMHGLDPNRTEHRIEGLATARAMIRKKLSAEEEADRRTSKPASGPRGSDLGCKFSGKELTYINANWGNVCHFMRGLKLDVGDDKHWQTAKKLAGVLLRTAAGLDDKLEKEVLQQPALKEETSKEEKLEEETSKAEKLEEETLEEETLVQLALESPKTYTLRQKY